MPNANTIIIDNAQNFGLSDLHQLRGRVGRSNRKAFCYLLTPPEETLSSDARRRLRAIEEFSDLGAGFNIAMQDLDIRGAGNLLGGEQSGFIADIGFETYQKILAEAIAELREEEQATAAPQEGKPQEALSPQARPAAFITDCPDRDRPRGVHSGRVRRQQHGEDQALPRARQHRRRGALSVFEANLRDRFGEIPAPTRELFDVVRMRWACIRLGFEKAIVKNGIMILKFIENQHSAYYKSDLFGGILKAATRAESKFIFRQNNNKLSVVVRNIKNISEATAALHELAEKAAQ